MESEYSWFVLFVVMNSAILFILTANVSRLRLKHQISVGDGGNGNLRYAIRAHSNGVEQVPIFAFIVLGLTLLHASQLALALFVVTFTVARLLHAFGMLFKSFLCRRVGASATYILQLIGTAALAIKLLI